MTITITLLNLFKVVHDRWYFALRSYRCEDADLQ